METPLSTSLKFLKGIGESRSKVLARELELHTFRDLLYYFPFRHVDRSRFYKISEFREDMPYVQVRGVFRTFVKEGEGAKRRLKGIFSDGSRLMEVIWFSKIDVISGLYKPGVPYVLFGRPSLYRGAFTMSHPEVEEYNEEKRHAGFEGVYNLTETMRKRGLGTRFLKNAVDNLLENTAFLTMSETLPAELLQRLRLMPLRDAIRNMHRPATPELLEQARRRMKFEELFYLELNILRYTRQRNFKIVGHVFPHIGEKFNRFFREQIPFELTGAQKRVIHEIRNDMRTGRQMNRLVQGDVGCGKTMVAFMSMLMAVDNGFQAAMMAPTEILASQHYETLGAWGEAIGVNVRLLTGSTRAKDRRGMDEMLRSGEIDILIGTHALLEEKVEFKNLGLAVIDEQHRFGVAQRARLWTKNITPPHVLVMTATPIPRTLAMTVYGDLDVSVIDELPPGRKPVDTRLFFDNNQQEMLRVVNHELRQGRQAYVVYPLIKENDKLSLKSLEQGYDYVCRTFPEYKVVYVHGKMKPAEKEEQMQAFASGEARIMVATTVIEVGVNVPNATVMVIHNAERFGLSQLHQLRGRVGRGADKSFCLLMTKEKNSTDTRKRLGVMTATTDGFLVAEADMKQRGPGDIEGTQQSGIAFRLNVADLARDGRILAAARDLANAILDANPALTLIQDSNARVDPALILDSKELSVLIHELNERYGRDKDWSQIS